MSQAKIIREELKENDTTYSAVLIEVKNAYIVLLSETEENLGTLAVSLPQKPETSTVPLSSILLGERNTTLARLVAERLVKSVNKIVLVSVHVRSLDERKVGRAFLKLLEKILKKMG
ncbi:MAG: proteasome assembly chaperone 4 family protein [Candidatus Bathyarchaeia archaeon]